MRTLPIMNMVGYEKVDFSERETKVTGMARSLEVIQISLDQENCIRTINPAGLEILARSGEVIQGQDFHQVLLKLNPDWLDLIPDDLHTLNYEPLFLPWEEDQQPGLGWNLMVLPTDPELQEGLLVSLIPCPAPENGTFIPEEGFGSELGSTMHKLFFRARQSETRFRQFLRLLPGVPYTQDGDLCFSYHNEQLKSMIGEKLCEQLGSESDWQKWIHPDDRPSFDQSICNCLLNRAPVSVRYRLQLPESDRILYILDIRIPVHALNGEVVGYEGLWLDLTRQSLAEKRLQQAAWKETLAEVTGSLSHDFNNILTGIVNLSDLMYTAREVDQVTFHYDLKIIRESSRQAQQIIQRIIALNREHFGELKLHNLSEILRQQTDLIQIILPRDVQLNVEVPEEEIPVMLDQTAIRRILLNFATNARDALEYKGKVTISLKVKDLNSYPRDHLLSKRCGNTGEAAELVFTDNGCGIPPKILHRIFDPYFSTKEAGRGSGLGLYSMTQFAQENGFDFGVRSWVGKGTEMYLLIPVEQMDSRQTSLQQKDARKRIQTPKRNQLRKVGLFATLDDSILHLTREFIGNGINVDNLEEASVACQWLDEATSGKQAIVVFMDHQKILPSPLMDKLRESNGRVSRIICYRGFNPDEISHLQGEVVDHIIEEHSHAGENLRTIMKLSLMESESEQEPESIKQ